MSIETFLQIIIGLLTALFTGFTCYLFYRERKSTLRSVVYEKQIEACYEIMVLFSELEERLKGWEIQKKDPNDIIYSGNYEEGTFITHAKLSAAIRKYYMILPNKIYNAITKLNIEFNQEIENMSDDKLYEFPWQVVSFNAIEVYDMIRIEFGIEKLHKSSKNVI